MKGIILAGGHGTRLYPLTKVFSKQLLPVYDKPLIYYPLSTLVLGGIREILIISTPQDTPKIEELLGDGSQIGLKLEYKVQEAPRGISEAFLLGADFIGDDSVTLILGDNIFYGNNLGKIVSTAIRENTGATVFAYYVKDPERFGVIEFNSKDRSVLSIEEKPAKPKTNWAAVGLYIYDSSVVARTKALKPSERGELEITDLNKAYLSDGKLKAVTFGRGYAWLDAGTHESLMKASNFVRIVEDNQSFKIACPEEIAYRMKYIDESQLKALAENYRQSTYGEYLLRLIERGDDGH
ncbi:MAG: glucose-1-phosphate thymidylyltransferase [Bradymonadales bacterium]|nr:MAG: glucose-1-phosphate thymidylyltransferase [Bradymonadales bacterium]